MKVSELKGSQLDYWVAKAEGYALELYLSGYRMRNSENEVAGFIGPALLWNYAPSRDWSQGGPIIEREQFAIIPVMGGTWCAERNVPTGGDDYEVSVSHGGTPLIAAMRCYVTSRFGEEVGES